MKLKLDKRVCVIIGAISVIAFTIVIILYMKSYQVGKAFQKKNFKQVQLTITHTVTDIQTLYGEGSTGEIDENQATYTEQLSNIRKNGTTLYEKNEFAEEYRYMRQGEQYILYAYNEPYDIETCKWIEVSVEERNPVSLFDFTVLEDYSAKDFVEVNDYYVPKGDVPAKLCEFIQVDSDEGYYDCDMKFYIEDGKLIKVVLSYIYKNKLDIERVYDFTYKSEDIEIPDANSI